MMLRITRLEASDAVVALRLEGWITEQTVGELDAACAGSLRARASLLLDLDGVRFVDAAGAARLRALRERGCVLSGCSAFLSEMVGDEPDEGRAPQRAGAAASDESELLRELRDGSAAAFERIVRQHGGALLAVARRFLASEDDARDVVQEAFISAFKGISSFGGGAKLSTWLHRIVVNAALMRLRSRRRRPEESIDDLLPCFDGNGEWVSPTSQWAAPTEAEVESRELRATVRRCIDRLPESYRTVLLLRDIEELDTEEAAEVLGVTPNAVKIRLHRARQALRTLLAAELGDAVASRARASFTSAAA